jgi:hypothetical protein
MARDLSQLDERHNLAIEVRTNAGRIFQAAFILKKLSSSVNVFGFGN